MLEPGRALRAVAGKSALRLPICLTLVWLLGLVPVISATASLAARRTGEELQVKAEQVAKDLLKYLQKFQNLPAFVAKLQLSAQVLQASDEAAVANANRFLYQTNKRLGSEAIYLLDNTGIVKASSNYQAENSFIGYNFSFRPYFIQALNGENSHYYAGGVATGRRGYFIAQPIVDQEQTLGVAVVKISIERALEAITVSDSDYLLLGLDGVIFASTVPYWRYKTLFPLPVETRQSIRRSRRYGPSEFEPVSSHDSREVFSLPQLSLHTAGGKRKYLAANTSMLQPRWHVFTLSSRGGLLGSLLLSAVVYSLAFWLLVLGWLYWRKRLEVQHHFEQMNVELERRVDRLTGDLKKSNQELRDLVDHYRATQTKLEETQDQLIQTAKLAVLGEMSAGINHELSQPLLALQVYIENSGRLMQAGQLETVESNLKEMLRVVVNMGKIVSRFKVFARRTRPEPRPSPANEIVEASMGIMQPLLKKAGVETSVEYTADSVLVYCEPVQVEQVLVNLLSNAAEALAETRGGRVSVQITETERQIVFKVRDNGPGIAIENLTRIFEPFFTTKRQGLGIGLALSRRIIETQSGTLEAAVAESGGMIFVVSLPKYLYNQGVYSP